MRRGEGREELEARVITHENSETPLRVRRAHSSSILLGKPRGSQPRTAQRYGMRDQPPPDAQRQSRRAQRVIPDAQRHSHPQPCSASRGGVALPGKSEGPTPPQRSRASLGRRRASRHVTSRSSSRAACLPPRGVALPGESEGPTPPQRSRASVGQRTAPAHVSSRTSSPSRNLPPAHPCSIIFNSSRRMAASS